MSLPAGTPNPYLSQGPWAPATVPSPPRRRGWPWALAATVVTSALWGGALLAFRLGDDEEPSRLDAYRFEAELCAIADMAAFEPDYRPYRGAEPTTRTSQLGPSTQSARDDVLDITSCEFTLKPAEAPANDFANVQVTYEAVWHKSADPGEEFTARSQAPEQYNDFDSHYDYQTSPLHDLGEEAYIIYREDAGTGTLNHVTVSVRDGWFTFSLTWDAFLGTDPWALGNRDRVREALTEATETTLAELRRA